MRKVLRIQPGRKVIASNGIGGAFLCGTESDQEKVTLVALEPAVLEPEPPSANLVLSILKGRDLEEPVEGLCQLPIHAIYLVTTDHTQEFKGQDHGRLIERLQAKSLVALKQAKKTWLTQIHAPVPLRQWKADHKTMPLILVHPGEDRLTEKLETSFAVLTGPEGGFSEDELKWLHAEKCLQIGLGPTRIRGSHAPLLACGKLMGLGWI